MSGLVQLPISRLVAVAVNLTPPGAQFPNLSTLLLLGTSNVIDVVQRMREYSDLAEVAADFGTGATEYLGAQDWFAQKPTPLSLNIGRWAKTASNGQLIGAPLSAAQQLLATWQAITAGSFTVHVDAGGAKNAIGMNFSAAGNLNAVATIINTELTSLTAGASIAWDANTQNFVMSSATTGPSSSVSFLTPEGAGTDISGMLGMTAASSGAYLANGIAAESAVSAVALFDNNFAGQWYGLQIPDAVQADDQAVAAYIEGDSLPHYFWVTDEEAACLTSTDTTSTMYLLSQGGYDRTSVVYSSTDGNASMSPAARMATVNWQGSNTAIDLMYQNMPGLTPENINTTQANAVQAKHGNVLAAYNNAESVYQYGQSASGVFTDTLYGIDWLQGQIQSNVFTLQKSVGTKIPQTDSGNGQIATAIEAGCAQGITNGFGAPGVWNAGGFGQITEGSYLSKGYYIYTPPISSQSEASRTNRESVLFQVAFKEAGAINTVNIAVLVNP